MSLKTVIFDMGNVLIHFSHVKACVQLAQLAGVSVEQVKEVLFDSGLETEYEAGLHTTSEVHSKLEVAFEKLLDQRLVIEAACDIFWPKPDMEELLRRVKKTGVRVVLLSNVNEAHFDYIVERYDFVKQMDALVLSYKVGCCKPNREIYSAAILAANAPASDCIFIDDVAENVAAAMAAGLPAHLFENAKGVEQALAERGLVLPA